ncbi:hypothetical protein GCM10011508_04110 [Flavobacterium lutivivi]|nr:hypothetical protein GCM10011508_04110 [Flavobacterium lutivivi]
MTTRTLKIILAGVLGAFALYIYFFPPNTGTDVVIVDEKNDTIKAPIDTTSLCMDYKEYNPSTLNTGLIRDMVEIYKANQLQSIQGSTTNPITNDAYSVWFDLDTIKKFIYHIEKGVQKNSTRTEKLGLRFYYGAYPKKMFWGKANGYEDLEEFLQDPVKVAYENKHTIVMMPTIDNGGKIIDFNPFDKNTYATGIAKPTSQFNGEPSNDPNSQIPVMALTGSGSTNNETDPQKRTAARNHGTLIPPGNVSELSF